MVETAGHPWHHKPATIDWFRMLWDMIQRGHTISAVAKRSGVAESTLRRYMQGSEPPWWRGEALIAIWCQACAKQREDLPMTSIIIAPRVVHPRGIEINREAAAFLQQVA